MTLVSRRFKVPESVYFDKAGKVLYVSNIDGEPWGKDGAGSIGKLGLDGKVIVAEWVKGLNAPKSMALSKGTLWVADLTEVVGIDVAKGADQGGRVRRVGVDRRDLPHRRRRLDARADRHAARVGQRRRHRLRSGNGDGLRADVLQERRHRLHAAVASAARVRPPASD